MSIGNYLTALDEQRDALARNLVTMGVKASETEKLNTLVPKVLQIPQTKPDVTLFRASIDTLHDYGESVYTFYNDGYRSLAGFTESYPHFCCEENGYAIYYNQPDFNWGQTIYTMCVEPVHITPVFPLRKLQGISMRLSRITVPFLFRSAGSALWATMSMYCMSAVTFLRESITLLGKRSPTIPVR